MLLFISDKAAEITYDLMHSILNILYINYNICSVFKIDLEIYLSNYREPFYMTISRVRHALIIFEGARVGRAGVSSCDTQQPQ